MTLYNKCWVSDEYHHDKDGYMTLRWEGRGCKAHRLSFFLHYGYWPKVCRHTCDNPACYNWYHLEDGTAADNNRDTVARGRHVSAKRRVTHCPAGHEYTVSNTILYRNHSGGVSRRCRTCTLAQQKARRARARAARRSGEQG